MHDRSLAQALERARHRAGVVDDAGRPLVSPHRLRHSVASVMLRERVPWPVVAAQLGHADPAITARIYAHLIDDRDLDLAAAAFEVPRCDATLREALRETGRSPRTAWPWYSRRSLGSACKRQVRGSVPLRLSQSPTPSRSTRPRPARARRGRRAGHLGQLGGAVLARRAAAEDDDVVVAAHPLAPCLARYRSM